MVVGHAIRAMGRIMKGLVSKSSTTIETKTSGEISLKTFHFSRPVRNLCSNAHSHLFNKLEIHTAFMYTYIYPLFLVIH